VLHPDEIERGDWFTPDYIDMWMEKKPKEFARALLLIWKLGNFGGAQKSQK